MMPPAVSSEILPYFPILCPKKDTIAFYVRSMIDTSVPRFPSRGYVRCGNPRAYLEGIITRVVEYQQTRLVLAITLHGSMRELWIAVKYRDVIMSRRQKLERFIRRGLQCLKEDSDTIPLSELAILPTSPLIRRAEEGGYYRQRFGTDSYDSRWSLPRVPLCSPLPPCNHFSRFVYTLEFV